MPSFIRIQDLADILIMSILVYQLYSWFRRTRAMQVLLGLGVVTLIYFVTRFLGLYMTSWILQELGTVLIVLIIVVFQAEIRQALYRFSLLRHLFDGDKAPQEGQFQEMVEALFGLAESRTGAIVVFQRSEALGDLMLNGVKLDCEITPQILGSIFADGTPLHDGAVLIRDGRIAQASCHLPLSTNSELPQFLGTRHRAALGLSERTDAVVAVVSEERGEVSLAVSGELETMTTPAALLGRLEQLITPAREPVRTSLPRRMFRNLLPKTAVLLIVTFFWLLVTSRQGQITTVMVPVRMHGLPEELVLVRSYPEEVDVQLKSFSSLTPQPSKLDISADIDLSTIREGQNSVRIRPSDITLPSGMEVGSISPGAVKIVAERKASRKVPVRVLLRGGLPRGLKGLEVVPQPASVVIEGPSAQVSRTEAVFTEEIDGRQLVKGKDYRVLLQPLDKKGITVREEAVQLKLIPRQR